MTVRNCNRRRSFEPILILASALIMLALGVVSCRQVSDVAGVVALDKSNVGECVRECNEDGQQATRAESQLHKVYVFLCHSNPNCLKQENQRHNDAIRRIEATRLACIQECHHQGGASGGR